jgi:hypothetical protein
MMLGVYPPGKNNYKITEEQKYNAVPPIEGFDFKPWIDEMGLEALPHQTTIFPIQMNGWSYDFMLALDDTNCPARGAARKAVQPQVDNAVKAIVTAQLPEMEANINKYGFSVYCSYINWAYTESIDLNTNMPIDQQWNTCQAAMKNVSQIYAQVETDSVKQVSSNDVRSRIAN